jgi:hypothetical protein
MPACDLAGVRRVGRAADSGSGEVLRVVHIQLDALDHLLGTLLRRGVLLGGDGLGQLLLDRAGTGLENRSGLRVLLSLRRLGYLVHQGGVVCLRLAEGVETEKAELLQCKLLTLLGAGPSRCGHLSLPINACGLGSGQGSLLAGDDFLQVA